MNKKVLIVLFVILLSSLVFAESISSLSVSTQVRLGEKVAVSGNYNNIDANSYVLCSFVIKDSNGFYVDRWTDEYTFSNGSFYAEKQVNEPPYYRGDTFVLTVVCGQSSTDENFTILQPLSLAHPVQKNWEYLFDEQNLEAMMILGSLVALVGGSVLVLLFFKKTGGRYAG